MKGQETMNIIPVEVGADLRTGFRYISRDNTGDNISIDNAYWGELTGIYWIWKNFSFRADDIIGCAHYNKYLGIGTDAVKQFVLNKQNRWIVLEPGSMVTHNYPEDILVIKDILKKYPMYETAWNDLYDNNGASKDYCANCSNCNMFFCAPEQFEKFCSFIFGVLFQVRGRIGDVDRVPYHKRYCAFLGERLLSVYLKANNYEFKTAPAILYVSFVDKIIHELSKIVKPDRNSKIYRILRHVLGRDKRKSSYSKK